MSNFYQTLATQRGDSPELRTCIERTVAQLLAQRTSTNRPGILLGKIQSGKTRAFLGVIALAFDREYDLAVVLTKGTVSLALQTLNRLRADFKPFIQADQIQVFDIMALPDLTLYELNQKLVLVVKKEDDNLKRLIAAFKETYPQLAPRKALIIDDEADLASVSFRRKNGEINPGVISTKIEELRNILASSDFLQVTATPYSLYLQPQEEVQRGGSVLFRPKRPAFTEILTEHPNYVGGEYYFENCTDLNSTAYFVYEEVALPERDALRREDRRRLRIEEVLTDKNSSVLRHAIVNFVMAAAIRRILQRASGQPLKKYAFLFHTEQARESHTWQQSVTTAIHDGLVRAAGASDPILESLLRDSYDDLKRSTGAGGFETPEFDDCSREARKALVGGYLMITKVNSDKDVDELLDENGQLKLRTPMNVFIGGQILDRGLTIDNMIGFYYGRNPNRFQQDTVLQHSRMYGARPSEDLAVTRFYAPRHIYQLMQKIHEFDTALREAFLSGAHDRGVYFIQRDVADRLVPCSPNKLMFSKLTSIRPGRRLLPMWFQTVAKTNGRANLQALDEKVRVLCGGKLEGTASIPVEIAVKLLDLAYLNLESEDEDHDDRKAHVAALEHLSKLAVDPSVRGNVLLIAAADRDVVRIREGGRFTNAPDTKQQADFARLKATNTPVLMLLRQNGLESSGWRELPFWWPVVVVPQDAVTSVFAAEAPAEEPAVQATSVPANPPFPAASAKKAAFGKFD